MSRKTILFISIFMLSAVSVVAFAVRSELPDASILVLVASSTAISPSLPPLSSRRAPIAENGLGQRAVKRVPGGGVE